MTRYRHDFAAFGEEVLNAPFMVAEMHRRAEAVQTEFEVIAPERTGEFKSSCEVESGTHGGVHHDRAYATVGSNDPAAQYIEFGTEDTPAHLTLTTAAGAAR